MPKMSVNAETLEAPKPVSAGWYKLRLKGMTIKKSPKGHNIEAYFTTVEQPSETNDKFVLYRMNNGFSQGVTMQEMSHGLGFAMDINADGTASLPGDWTLKDANKPDEWDLAQYSGVLLGKVGEAELVVDSYQGNEKNVVKQWKCKLDQCAVRFPKVRHQTDLIGKKG
jgi:hypothetical protein